MSFEHLLSATGISLVEAIIIGSFGAYLISSTGTATYNLYFHPLAGYPGPALRAAFHFPDALSRLRGRAYKDTKLLHDQYGSVVRMLPDALSYNTAQAWKGNEMAEPETELAKDPTFYRKGKATNILTANQSDHTRFRKLLAHSFSDSALLEQEPLLTLYFDLLVLRLKQQIDGPTCGRVDIMAYYNFTTFDIIGDLVLGEPFGALESSEYHPWIKLLALILYQVSLTNPHRDMSEVIKLSGVIRLAATYPIFGLLFQILQIVVPSFSAKRAANMKFAENKVNKRLERKTDRKDFTTYILRDNDDRGMTRQEILPNSRVVLTAGSETTATLLSGATYYLLRNPAIMHRVQSEIRTVHKTADDITLRSVSTPGLLPYLDAVLQESLRCYPSVPATLPRITSPEGAVIEGRYVPGNISVGVHQWSTYRSKDNFASPDTFDPERWLPDPPVKYRGDNKAAFQPFSLGPRGCIGKSLAYFEMRSILSRVLWNFDMHLEEASQGWTEQKEYTLWDKPPLWVRLEHKVGT